MDDKDSLGDCPECSEWLAQRLLAWLLKWLEVRLSTRLILALIAS